MKANILTVSFVILLLACNSESDPASAQPKVKKITTVGEATKAYSSIRAFLDGQIKPKVNMNATNNVSLSITGTKGTSNVTGKVTYSKSSSSLSSYTSTIFDVTSAFNAYDDGTTAMTGSIRYFESSSFESRCTSSGSCASASKASGAYSGSSFSVEFKNDKNEIVKDVIALSADRDNYYASWKIKVTSSSGESFSF